MTEERLVEILQKQYEKDFSHMMAIMPEKFSATYYDTVVEAMKQAVNEALDEAANKAEAWVRPSGEWTSSNETAEIKKDSILNLKVK